MSSNLKTVYAYDKSGYFSGTTVWQNIDGEPLKVPGTTDICPWGDRTRDTDAFYKFDGERWVVEAKPTNAEDLVGIEVSHTSMTPHDVELRRLVQEFGRTDGYRIVRGDDLSWKIERIPEKTEAEKKAEAEEQARAKRDAIIAATDFLLMADYPISAEDLEAVKAYRQALRDVPEQEGFPTSVEWPEIPDIVKEAS